MRILRMDTVSAVRRPMAPGQASNPTSFFAEANGERIDLDLVTQMVTVTLGGWQTLMPLASVRSMTPAPTEASVEEPKKPAKK
jgi:hypothetical protein